MSSVYEGSGEEPDPGWALVSPGLLDANFHTCRDESKEAQDRSILIEDTVRASSHGTPGLDSLLTAMLEASSVWTNARLWQILRVPVALQ